MRFPDLESATHRHLWNFHSNNATKERRWECWNWIITPPQRRNVRYIIKQIHLVGKRYQTLNTIQHNYVYLRTSTFRWHPPSSSGTLITRCRYCDQRIVDMWQLRKPWKDVVIRNGRLMFLSGPWQANRNRKANGKMRIHKERDKSSAVHRKSYRKGFENSGKARVNTVVKPHCTFWRLLVHPKDKVRTLKKANCVYRIPCKSCDKSYVGETGRSLDIRMEEHRKDADKSESRPYTRSSKSLAASEIHKSAITDHVVTDNHVMDWDNIRVLDREEDRTRRWIKEAIW